MTIYDDTASGRYRRREEIKSVLASEVPDYELEPSEFCTEEQLCIFDIVSDKEEYIKAHSMVLSMPEHDRCRVVRKEVIRSYFGVDCDRMTLEAIGAPMNLSKERVRQILGHAINDIRKANNVQ